MNELFSWFQKEKRDFPWRINPSAYAVWVSEVMLQQTRASVVIPYFLRWMQLFPTPQELATAQEEEVIKLWEGLGYYSRARYLHQGAKEIVKRGGALTPELLTCIKGIGPYTQAAILAFAFHERSTPIDGNVLRVLARYLGIEEDISKPATKTLMANRLEQILPQKEPWVYSEALIELGAVICQKKPLCPICPLQKTCVARKRDRTHLLPYKSKKTLYESIVRDVAIVTYQEHMLLFKKEEGIMRGLYEFPYFTHIPDQKEALLEMQKALNIPLVLKALLPAVTHTFTRFRCRLYPFVLEAREKPCYPLVSQEEVCALPFSSGHKRVLEQFLTNRPLAKPLFVPVPMPAPSRLI